MSDHDDPARPGDPEQKALGDLEHAERDLKAAEEEIREAEEELEKARKLITIIVDGAPYQVRRGKWIVRELKATLEIDQAKVLAQITPHGLKDLDDNAEIELHDREQFMTHARSGGSS
ncbi:hypothetical protein [Bradyrhizobium sp. USDA 4502]